MGSFSPSLSKVNVLLKKQRKKSWTVWQAHSLNLGCLRLEGQFTKRTLLLKMDVAAQWFYLCGSILRF